VKRISNLFNQICSVENLRLADQKARRGKLDQYGVKRHDQQREENLLALHEQLVNRNYRTSEYLVRTIVERKTRVVYKLPYYPDRITHHAIMNILEPIFVAHFTADTYSSIKGRGLHLAADNVKIALRDKVNTAYCLKMDITQFYPSINHDILKAQLRRKFKDLDLLWLLDEIIDSAPGVPIGNYLSQYFANFYLTGFDRWVKQEKGVRYYFRYADDLVIFGADKQTLHALAADIRHYLSANLKLSVKDNYQVFPVAARGVDFLGYKFYHTHTRLRKSIKRQFARRLAKGASGQTVAAYWGWVKHCNSRNLMKKLTGKKSLQA